MPSLTQEIARFAAGMHRGEVPAGARDIVVSGVIDTIGTTVAGRNEPVVNIVRATLGSVGRGEARVLFGNDLASAADAALVNATAGHALDYDDVAMGGHPSTVLVPALLAQAEAIDAPGDALIRAYVVGYEVWAELYQREPDPLHRKGWHPTSVYGVVAAAAACASMRGLDEGRARHAVGIAASMPCGLVANFGTMTKPFHAGRAAQAAVVAVDLASRGMTASPDVIEHNLGFLRAISPDRRVDTTRDSALGRDWRLPRLGLNVKKYPACYATHRSLDAMIALRNEHSLAAQDIAAIEVEMSETQAAALRNERPQTGLDAKFSEQFAMAAATLVGRAGLGELTDEFVQRPDVQAFFPKVTMKLNKLRDEDDPVFSPTEKVVVRLADGRTLEREVRYARGHARAPLSSDDLWTKFSDCLAGACPAASTRQLFDAVQRLDKLRSVRELPAVLAAPAPARHAS